MRNAILSILFLSVATSNTIASDWLTMPSTYSHDAITGQRVSQYKQIEIPTTSTVPSFRTSGYTHARSRIAFGGSIDNYHQVETWGPPVRPYGEWQRPFRPFSVPYSMWGPPFAGLNLGFRGLPHPYPNPPGDQRRSPRFDNPQFNDRPDRRPSR